MLTFTSGGAANAEMWVRDWIETWGLHVHVLDRTMSLAAINVTGPLAGGAPAARSAWPSRRGSSATSTPTSPACPATSCACASPARPPFELHHPVDRSVELWRALLDAGRATSGIRPHGLQALFGLRLEKGHVIVGMDTELDSTPRRLGHGLGGPDGQAATSSAGPPSSRTATLPDDRRLVGFTMDGPAPVEGSADLRRAARSSAT